MLLETGSVLFLFSDLYISRNVAQHKIKEVLCFYLNVKVKLQYFIPEKIKKACDHHFCHSHSPLPPNCLLYAVLS